MARKATDPVTTIGIDIGKNNFHLIGLDGAGNNVLRRRRPRIAWRVLAGERHYGRRARRRLSTES